MANEKVQWSGKLTSKKKKLVEREAETDWFFNRM